jgi:hypothetical protein
MLVYSISKEMCIKCVQQYLVTGYSRQTATSLEESWSLTYGNHPLTGNQLVKQIKRTTTVAVFVAQVAACRGFLKSPDEINSLVVSSRKYRCIGTNTMQPVTTAMYQNPIQTIPIAPSTRKAESFSNEKPVIAIFLRDTTRHRLS